MTIFHLPDLGEGLAEATIHEWFINEGDEIKTDQNMVSVETAKALVDIPAPYTGKIKKLFFKAGDSVKTGEALLEIETTSKTATVAGKLDSSEIILEEESSKPAMITKTSDQWQSNAEKLSGIRLNMAQNMRRSHREVVSASIFEEIYLPHSSEKIDFTVKLIQALCFACKTEPALNTWYDGSKQVRLMHSQINLGLAMDAPQGLLVPVIKNAEEKNDKELRVTIDDYKKRIQEGHLSPELFQGATITLSNIGNISGRFATPIIMPPAVAILAVGKTYEVLVKENNDIISKKTLPLSLSFDHRAVTGAEGSRFLKAMQDFFVKQ